MTLPLTLPTGKPEQPAMDYTFLRSEGIRLLERLDGSLWTDFNAHDPGITILEQLCYAITDLSYRINYDVKDILASGGEKNPYRSLNSPAQVLTTNPITLIDLRKRLLDVPGVKNAWLEPVETTESAMEYDPSENCIYLKTSAPQYSHRKTISLRGLYKVVLEVDNTLGLSSTDILTDVNQSLYACRTLAGDFLTPEILPGQGIVVRADVEVSGIDNPELLLAKIYYKLLGSISPRIRFYTLSEMLAKGKQMDEIMDGPFLKNGYIDDTDLEGLQRKIGLRTSDLIQEILNEEGAISISSIKIEDNTREEAWYFKLDPQCAPFLDIDKSLFSSPPAIRLIRSGIEVKGDPIRVKKILEGLNKRNFTGSIPVSKLDVTLPEGLDRNIGKYYSIQNQFPITYGIGPIGLPDSASPERKAQARQLKAYLMFFDQLLANLFAQLENSKSLFSFYAQEQGSYFSQIISEEYLNFEDIYRQELNNERLRELTEKTALGLEASISDKNVAAERKNRFLNHLLARFAEQFTDYYSPLYDQKSIENKSAFLRDYHQIGAARGSGFDYFKSAWGTGNISGLEKRISRKLGISNNKKCSIASMESSDGFGFHMLEHILLRPGQADDKQWMQAATGAVWQASAFLVEPACSDPYSNQVSFIFPKWAENTKENDFFDFITKTLREETPAHIRIHQHWLDKDEMLSFEAAYKTWLENLLESRGLNLNDGHNHSVNIRLRDSRDKMVQILGIGVPYPLRDLKLDYPPMVAYKRQALIHIIEGQRDVEYLLCDEDGNPLINDEKELLAEQPTTETPKDVIFLKTPAIVKDITFTVLAIREDKKKNACIETYLNQSVSIKVGIDTSLSVAFSKSSSNVFNYGDKVSVSVSKTQEGISYELVTGSEILSKAEKGNQGEIILVSNRGIEEDSEIAVQAYRTDGTDSDCVEKNPVTLDTKLYIQVRPNPAIQVDTKSPIVDYGKGASLILISPQSSVEYRLFKRELKPDEYLGSEEGGFSVANGEGRDIFIKTPGTVNNWDTPDGFTQIEPFKDKSGILSADTGSLTEDTLFIIQATKINNRERIQLRQNIAILVRPDLSPAVSTQADAVESGQTGIVTLENTQNGVFYQLRLDADNKLINPPGYHLTDRGVGTTRLEVDMVVEDQGKPILLLPTNAIEAKTYFNILACKILSGVKSQIKGRAIIDIKEPLTNEVSDKSSGKTPDESGELAIDKVDVKTTKKPSRNKKKTDLSHE